MTITATRTATTTHESVFAELDARTTGTVAVPGDEAYDALVSPWNVAIPVEPVAVLAAQDAQDVVEAVRFAGRHGLRVTPQATGHGPSPTSSASCSSAPRASTSASSTPTAGPASVPA